MTRTDTVFVLWLLPWALLGILCILGLVPLGYVYGYGLASLLLGVPLALSSHVRQLMFLVLWRLGFKHGVTPRSREQHLRDHVPELFQRSGALLYVGAYPGRDELVDALWRTGYEITLLEIWRANVLHFADDQRFKHVICGDVRDFAKVLPDEPYDTVVWWHGPEHVTREQAETTLAALQRLAPLVVLATPWGLRENEMRDGNHYNLHLSTWYEEDFAALGYETATMGDRDAVRSQLLAWKRRT